MCDEFLERTQGKTQTEETKAFINRSVYESNWTYRTTKEVFETRDQKLWNSLHCPDRTILTQITQRAGLPRKQNRQHETCNISRSVHIHDIISHP